MDYWSENLFATGMVSTPLIVLLVVFVIVSAFFSMSETVFSSVNIIRLKNNADQQVKGSKKALWITDNYDLTLSTILVGNNLSNIALTTISVIVFTQFFEILDISFVNANLDTVVTLTNTIVLTIVVLIFGEILPKSYGKAHADTLALKLSNFLYFVINLLKIFTFFFIKLQNAVITKNYNNPTVTEDELESIIDTMEEEGSIDGDEADMLQSVLDLDDTRVYDIMTHRVDMVSIDINADIENVKEIFFLHQFSRIPVYKGSHDNIVGILYERDFFTKLIKKEEIDISLLMKKALYVTKDTKVDTLIETLQKENSHIAIVSDEYGGTSGIVTMEDALEELVGEIYDEHDLVKEQGIAKINAVTYRIDAHVELDDLFEELNLGLLPQTGYSTLGGWLYELFATIPKRNSKITYRLQKFALIEDEEVTYNVLLHFTILGVKERRITFVKLVIEDTKKSVK